MCLKRNLLAFVILFVVLVFSLFSMSGVQASPQNSENENIRVHEGDLVVESGENFVLKSKKLLVRGNFFAKPGSRFRLENSKLMIDLKYSGKTPHHWVKMMSKGEIINSTIEPVGDVFERYEEKYESFFETPLELSLNNSDIKIEDSKIRAAIGFGRDSEFKAVNSKFSEIDWTTPNEVIFENSIIGSFVLKYSNCLPGKEKVTFNGLEPGKTVNFSKNTGENGSLKLENTVIKRNWWFNLELPTKDLTIENSKIDMIWTKIPHTEERAFLELPRGFIENYTLGENFPDPGLPYTVGLVDTELGQFKIELLNANAEIENTKAMVHPSGNTDLIIRNSVVSPLRVYGVEKLKLINSRVGGPLTFDYRPGYEGGWEIYGMVVGPGGTGRLVFENTVLDGVPYIKVFGKRYVIEGEVEINSPDSMEKVHWVEGEITRSYPVIIKDRNERPVSDISVSLWDNENRKVWSGESDENGRTSFSITFNENNYDKIWRVEANYPDVVNCQKINFLSDTPVVIVPFPEFSVVNIGVQPQEIKVGETVEIYIDVRNTGGLEVEELEIPLEGFPDFTEDQMSTWVHPRSVSISENKEIKVIGIENASLNTGEERHINISASLENAGAHQLTVGDESKTIQVERSTQPYFKVTDFSISEENVGLGEEVKVSVEVTNTGRAEGSKTIKLRIEGEIADRETVTLSPGEFKAVEFTISKEKAGTYQIKIGELSKTLYVKKPEKAEKGLPWALIGGIIVVVIAISAFALYKRE